jgi:hypothetical protein
MLPFSRFLQRSSFQQLSRFQGNRTSSLFLHRSFHVVIQNRRGFSSKNSGFKYEDESNSRSSNPLLVAGVLSAISIHLGLYVLNHFKTEEEEEPTAFIPTSLTVVYEDGQLNVGFPIYRSKEDILYWLKHFSFHPDLQLATLAFQLIFGVEPSSEDSFSSPSSPSTPLQFTPTEVSVITGMFVGLCHRHPDWMLHLIRFPSSSEALDDSNSIDLKRLSPDRQRWVLALLWYAGSSSTEAKSTLCWISNSCSSPQTCPLHESNRSLLSTLIATPPTDILEPSVDLRSGLDTSSLTLHSINALSGYFLTTDNNAALVKMSSLGSLLYNDDYQGNLKAIQTGSNAITRFAVLCSYSPRALLYCLEELERISRDSQGDPEDKPRITTLQQIIKMVEEACTLKEQGD